MNKLLLVIGLCLFSITAMAESSTMNFTPPSTDYSVGFLGNIFGVVDGVLHGTGSQVMGAIFSVFNAAVLALGGIVIMYTLIVGTMNTAHEGKMLGQKWSSIWIPVRSTIGLALLIPKSSGYCLMQIFVMWIVVQGVGAADKVWDAVLDYLNEGGVIIKTTMSSATSSSADSGHIADAAQQILAGQVCMLGLQKQLETQRQNYLDASSSSSPSGPCAGTPTSTMQSFCSTTVPDFLSTVDAIAWQNDQDPNGTQVSTQLFVLPMPNFKNNPTYESLNGVCGNIEWLPIAQAVSTTSSSGTETSSLQSSIPGLTSSNMDSIRLTRATAIQQMYMDLSTLATSMVSNDPQITPTQNSTTSGSGSSTAPAYPSATTVLGLAFLSNGTTACTGPSADCTVWSGETVNSVSYSALLAGTEFSNAILDYNGIMMSTVNLINEANNSQDANASREFITTSKSQGWLTAGSYFFDLVWLNGSATSGGNQTDTNTGLENTNSANAVSNLTQVFPTTSGDACPNTSTGAPSSLCTYLNAQVSYVQSVIDLVGPAPNASGVTVTQTTSQNASTAFGYSVNARNISLPGQPSTAMANFNVPFNFNVTSSLGLLPKKHFACGTIGILTCAGRTLGNIFYNDFIRWILNIFVGYLALIENAILMAAFYIPYQAISTIFINGVAIIQNTGANPIVALANMGTAYINESVTIWLQLINVVFMLNVLMPIGIIMVVLISPILISWLGTMVAIGFSTAYYIPFVPFLVFSFGVIGWLMAVIEAMVAAPIVALGVTHPEGEGILGKGEQALMILMNVFLRPSMMIIGYVAAIALCYVSVWIINSGFAHVMQFTSGTASSGIYSGAANGYNNWAGIYAFFFSIVIYTTTYIAVAEKSFTLIYLLPDQVLRWIGGHAEQTGSQTAQWGEEGKRKTDEAGKSSLDAQGQTQKKIEGAATSAAAAASAPETGGASLAAKGASDGGGAAGGGGEE